MGTASFVRARDRLVAAERAQSDLNGICAAIMAAFHDVTRFSAGSVLVTDSETLLPCGGVVEGFTPEMCAPFWDHEFLDPDFNKFAVLATSVERVATLAQAVDGDLSRSPRYCKLYEAFGVADEMRVAFVAGTTCLAVGAFVRADGDGPFPPEDLVDVRALVPVAATALRRALGRLCDEVARIMPAVVIVGPGGDVVGMTDGAERLLADLRADIDDELPVPVRAAVTRVRWSRRATFLSTRALDNNGRWYRVSASPMQGDARLVAITIEPARPDDLARVLLDAYSFTEREREVALLLVRGWPVKQIATELAISAHTVRDHIKVVYEKAGVASRGEFVANLFVNHVLEPLHRAVARIG